MAHNPNHPPSSTPNHRLRGGEQQTHDDPFEFIVPSKLQELRDRQNEYVNKAANEAVNREPANSDAAREAARNKAMDDMDGFRDEYLQDIMGVDKNDPRYPDYFDWVAHASIDNMGEAEWRNGLPDADGNREPSGKDLVTEFHDEQLDAHRSEQRRQARMRRLNPDPATSPLASSNPIPPISPIPHIVTNIPNPDPRIAIPHAQINALDHRRRQMEINQMSQHLNVCRERLAQLGSQKNANQNPDFARARHEYADLLIRYGHKNEQLLLAQKPNRTMEQRNAATLFYLADQSRRLRDLTTEKMTGTPLGKLCNFLASGNIAQRTAKGMGLGLLIGAAVAGGGIAGAAAGGVAIIAGRFGRGYAMSRGKNAGLDSHLSAEETYHLGEAVKHNEHSIEQATRLMTEKYYGAALSSEKGKRHKAIAMGGIAVLAGVIGSSFIGEVVDSMGHGPGVTGLARPEMGGGTVAPTPPTVEVNPHIPPPNDVPGGSTLDPTEVHPPGESTFPDKIPEKPPVSPTEVPEVPPTSPDIPGAPDVPPHPEEVPPGPNMPSEVPGSVEAPVTSLQDIFNPETVHSGVDVPLREGDGILDLGQRYGLSDAQIEKMTEMLGDRTDGTTYLEGNDVRLFLNNGAFHLTGPEINEIFSTY